MKCIFTLILDKSPYSILTYISVFTDGKNYSSLERTISLLLRSELEVEYPCSIFYEVHAKINHMPGLKLKQLQYENDAWKRLLGFLMDENIHLKNRLSEVLKGNSDKDLLYELENFQSQFINKDELISVLRNDVAEIDKLLIKERVEDGIIVEKVCMQLKKLRDNIQIAEKQLGKLKSEFNSFLLENI